MRSKCNSILNESQSIICNYINIFFFFFFFYGDPYYWYYNNLKVSMQSNKILDELSLKLPIFMKNKK